jgi:hypothetical protein
VRVLSGECILFRGGESCPCCCIASDVGAVSTEVRWHRACMCCFETSEDTLTLAPILHLEQPGTCFEQAEGRCELSTKAVLRCCPGSCRHRTPAGRRRTARATCRRRRRWQLQRSRRPGSGRRRRSGRSGGSGRSCAATASGEHPGFRLLLDPQSRLCTVQAAASTISQPALG